VQRILREPRGLKTCCALHSLRKYGHYPCSRSENVLKDSICLWGAGVYEPAAHFSTIHFRETDLSLLTLRRAASHQVLGQDKPSLRLKRGGRSREGKTRKDDQRSKLLSSPHPMHRYCLLTGTNATPNVERTRKSSVVPNMQNGGSLPLSFGHKKIKMKVEKTGVGSAIESLVSTEVLQSMDFRNEALTSNPNPCYERYVR
jgi:hypothetical protein